MIKSKSKSKRTHATVELLIRKIEEKNLKYTIARNYETYPDFNNDLDLFYDSDLSLFEEIARQVCIQCGWDYLKSCRQFSGSIIQEHNIFIYYFVSKQSLEKFQVDLFCGFLVYGIPLLSSTQIVEQRQRHKSNNFYIPNVSHESLIRIFQINKLYLTSGYITKKLHRYIERFKSQIAMNNCDNFIAFVNRQHIKFPKQTLALLLNDQLFLFSKSMKKIKRDFLLTQFLSYPTYSLRCIISRVVFYIKVFWMNSPGSLAILYYNSNADLTIIHSSLKSLEASFIFSKCVQSFNYYFMYSPSARKILERNGCIIILKKTSDPRKLEYLRSSKDVVTKILEPWLNKQGNELFINQNLIN